MNIKNIIISSTVRKITYIVIALLLAVLSEKVFAADTNPLSYYYSWPSGACPTCTFKDSNDDACNDGLDFQRNAFPGNDFTFTGTSNNQCLYDNNGGSNSQNMLQKQMCNGVLVSAGSCVDAVCILPEVLDSATNTCILGNPCEEISGEKFYGINYTGSSTTSVCSNGCELALGGVVTVCTASDACYAEFATVTGDTCTGTNEPLPDPEQECLAKGKSFITLGGVTKCLSQGDSDAEPLITKQVTEKDTTIIDNVTGDSSNENVKKELSTTLDNKVRTETIIVDDDGNSQTTVEEEDKVDYCDKNPTAKICEEEPQEWEKPSTGDGSFDDAQAEIDDAKADLFSTFNQIKSEIETQTASTIQGGGSLSCDSFTAMGTAHDMCIAEYQDELLPLAAFFVFLSFLIGLWIVLK